MKEEELRSFAIEVVQSSQVNAEITRKLQTQVDAQATKLRELSLEKESIGAKRDQVQMKLDVYMQIVDELLERILKHRGYNE